MPDVAVVGSLHYDLLLRVPRLPLRGETLTGAVASAAAGGKGANQAAQCAKLGLRTVLLGCVGRDAMGETLRVALRDAGVDDALLLVREGVTGMGVVYCLPDGSVYATVASGVNRSLSSEDVWNSRNTLVSCRALMTQNEVPKDATLAALELARGAGLYRVFNGAPALPALPEAFPLCDCLMFNEAEVSAVLNRAVVTPEDALSRADDLRSLGAECCVVTLGEKGSVLVNRREATWIPALEGTVVLETTGAGDSYAGAFVAAKLRGAGDAAACRFATRAAAFTVGGVGAQPAMPTWKDLGGQ